MRKLPVASPADGRGNAQRHMSCLAKVRERCGGCALLGTVRARVTLGQVHGAFGEKSAHLGQLYCPRNYQKRAERHEPSARPESSRPYLTRVDMRNPWRPVKLVSECLGVARSRLTVRIKQSASPKVRRSRPVNDLPKVVSETAALLTPYMGHYTHLTERLPPNVRNISPTLLLLETLRSDLLTNLNFLLHPIVMAHSLLPPLVPATDVIPDI
ncbi:hypothetical protein PS880_00344 [Pseudomonas fluorescens]|uniref:Uncharacterized protein n=1 Tax=Pseudomonas fluorescens TaxID=294 RepID=A0A5E7GSV7_PSEFL|nr:hypothetical protein PS880_00344 [Pseudomonas fluorescens]